MGRQQRNRHPANRLGQRRRSYRIEDTATRPHDPERAGQEIHQPTEEMPAQHRPSGPDFSVPELK